MYTKFKWNSNNGYVGIGRKQLELFCMENVGIQCNESAVMADCC